MSARPQIRQDLSAMEGYHSPQVTVSVRLNTNEAPEPPPEAFRTAMAAAVADVDWHRYPDRAATELRSGLARYHNASASSVATQPVFTMDALTMDNVFCANGSNEVLQTLLLTFGGPGRSALVVEPTYALHSHLSRITGTGVLTLERNADFTLDADQLRQTITEHEPAIVFLCSPNNPTGRTEDPEVVKAVARQVGGYGGLLIVDEAYAQFASWSALELLDEQSPIVVTRTFSKTWSMAAIRLGYLLGPTWLVAELEKVVMPYHLDAVTQLAGTLALEHADAMEERVARLREQRGRVQARLGELAVDVVPSEANFILFRPRDGDGDGLWQRLLDRDVLVRNCASWDRLEGNLRVTIGSAEENDAFLEALAESLDAVS